MGDRTRFYEELDLPKDASPEQVRKAYKSLVRRWHPDKNPSSSKREAEAKFAAITRAYEALVGGELSVPDTCSTKSSREVGTRRTAVLRPWAVGTDMGTSYFKRKPPPIERKMECSLEELFRGCRKEVRYTRDVVGSNGIIYKKEEVQTVKVKPGWRKGHKITLKEMGDERPGSIPSDVTLLVTEKTHPHFKRVDNDLVLKVEVPLVNALAGWKFSFRRLDGEKMTCSFEDEIIFPGYEKVIKGEGMPIASRKGQRGDLRIKFSIVFPRYLSNEQSGGLRALLGECT